MAEIVVYEHQNFKGCDFSNRELIGVKFVLCEFDDTLFLNANLSDAQFIRCRASGPVVFDGANMRGCKIESSHFQNSKFNRVNLSYSHITGSSFAKSSLLSCNFNEAEIDDLDISLCNLHLASFVNAQISSLNYYPVRPIPYMRGLKPFRKTAIQQNTIFINGNKHLGFTEYCNSELRKDKFFTSVNKTNPLYHPMAVLFLLLFGLLTDFGQSFARWTICTIGIIVVFALFPLLLDAGVFETSIKDSMLAFFGMGIRESSWLYIIESIVGYFMLGALISLLTSKLSID